MSRARDLAHAGQRPLMIPPRVHDASRAPRYRFAGGSGHLKGCPLRHDYDERGTVRLVACADIKGTLEACRVCQR